MTQENLPVYTGIVFYVSFWKKEEGNLKKNYFIFLWYNWDHTFSPPSLGIVPDELVNTVQQLSIKWGG